MLILASASQSRKKLLENCQIEFIQIPSDFDETTIQEKNIFNLALELSFQKANSIFVLYIFYWSMSVSKSKNLERKLDNYAKEAKNQLNNVCGSSLWESLGFVFFDQLEDSEKIAKANFYYGQLQIINEIKFSI